jgi:hypothetical protein
MSASLEGVMGVGGVATVDGLTGVSRDSDENAATGDDGGCIDTVLLVYSPLSVSNPVHQEDELTASLTSFFS